MPDLSANRDNMDMERRTTRSTAILLIDYLVGFANLFRSQPLAENINNALALANFASGWDIPLLLTAGPGNALCRSIPRDE